MSTEGLRRPWPDLLCAIAKAEVAIREMARVIVEGSQAQ